MQSSAPTPIKYYRPVRLGPEALLDAAVARSIEQVITRTTFPRWLAGSLPIGAGMPDLLAISWNPRVVAIADQNIANAAILAYLRAVGCARFETIISRLGWAAASVAGSLDALVQASVVVRDSERFSLDPAWRSILPEVVAIEAKVVDWRKAIAQAARNQLFAHRSFVALPTHVAERAAADSDLCKLGIGVLGVEADGTVSIVREALARRPKVWTYYYQLAHHVAQDTHASRQCHSSSRSTKRAQNIQNTPSSVA
jgi:hypothetical protein